MRLLHSLYMQSIVHDNGIIISLCHQIISVKRILVATIAQTTVPQIVLLTVVPSTTTPPQPYSHPHHLHHPVPRDQTVQ